MNKIEIEEIEIDLLLEAIYKRYGYDFRHYSRSSINRRIKHFLSISGLKSITAMTEKLLFDNSFFQSMVNNFSITVTEMFRDPKFYLTLREEVIPFLKTYPFIKIWHAGCATGEEAYSLAIVLHEENFLDRTRIIATDFNDLALEQAKSGVFPIHNLKIFADNYQNAGGKATLSDYYKPKYESIIINQNLKDKIYFANHNLVVDKIFCEANLILCRNVLIYFDKTLQNRVLNLFHQSLTYGGFLGLGNKESLQFSDIYEDYVEIENNTRIYQKKTNRKPFW